MDKQSQPKMRKNLDKSGKHESKLDEIKRLILDLRLMVKMPVLH